MAATPSAARRLRALATASRREPVYKFLIGKIEFLMRHDAMTGLGIGQVGFSMGGHWAFWLAQQEKLPITATVTFYAARSGDYSQTRSSFLCHFAENDPWVSGAAVKKLARHLDSAGVSSTFHQYPGTKHWFFESDRNDSFEPKAAELAWKRTIRFLGGNLPPGNTRRGAAGAARQPGDVSHDVGDSTTDPVAVVSVIHDASKCEHVPVCAR